MYDYKEAVSHIHVPQRLNRQVLAACESVPGKAPRRAFFRAAVCTACALALVLGSVTLRSPEGQPTAVTSDYHLGITALAADLTENHTLFFPIEDGAIRFRASAQSLTASQGTLSQEGDIYTLSPTAGQAPESLDGTALTLSAGEQTEVYFLTAENARAFVNESGREVLAPVLSGDEQGAAPVLYAASSESRFLSWPVAGSNTVSLSNSYGTRQTPQGGVFHSGIDIPAQRGVEITAAESGTVTQVGWNDTLGFYVTLDHGGGLTTLYGQCQEILAGEGNAVEAGDVIALLGSTGMSTGPHLHFEVRENGEVQNPVAYFSADIRDTLRAK